MSSVKWMGRAGISGVAGAVALSLGSYAAEAAAFSNPTNSTGILYASQSVAQSPGGGTITVPSTIQYTSNPCTPGATNSFSVTFTLPSGVTFATNPSATGSGVFNPAMSQVSGGINQNFITFTGTENCTAPVGGVVTLGSFVASGVQALASPLAPTDAAKTIFPITGAMSSTDSGLNDSGTKAQFAASASAVQFSSVGDTQGGLLIDINNPALAARFIQAKKDSTVGDQGAVLVLEPGGLKKFDNTGDFQAPTAASITLTGNWGGIGSAFLLKGAGAQAASCPTTAPSDSIAGTVSGSTITFPSVTLPGSTGATNFFEVCLVTNAVPGSTIIQANPKTTVALGAAGATLITGGTSTGLDAYDYNGNAQVLSYSGDFGGTYQFFVRLVNNTNAVANVFAVAQSDSGATGTAQIESSMAVNTNDLIPASTIFANAGVVLPDSGRGSLTILAPANVVISQVLLNPDGSVANIQ